MYGPVAVYYIIHAWNDPTSEFSEETAVRAENKGSGTLNLLHHWCCQQEEEWAEQQWHFSSNLQQCWVRKGRFPTAKWWDVRGTRSSAFKGELHESIDLQASEGQLIHHTWSVTIIVSYFLFLFYTLLTSPFLTPFCFVYYLFPMYIYLSIFSSPLANLSLVTYRYCPRILYSRLYTRWVGLVVSGIQLQNRSSGNMDCKAAALGYTALFLGEFGGGAGEG